MAGAFNFFITIQEFYKSMGLDTRSPQTYFSKRLVFTKSLFLFSFTVQLFISSSAYLLFEARTADELGISFYISITILSVMINTVSVAWRIDEIFVLIGKYEEFVEKS